MCYVLSIEQDIISLTDSDGLRIRVTDVFCSVF